MMNKTRTFRALGLTAWTTFTILNTTLQAKAQQNAPTVQVESRRGGNFGGAEGIFELPEGLDSLVPIDPINGILVRGDAGGVESDAVEVQARQRPARRGRLEMPEGIASIVAIDAINSLLVQTTGADDEPIQTRASALEQPMRQVQFDVRVIEVPKAAEKGAQTGAVVTNLPSREKDELEAQLLSGAARVVHVGRVFVPHNLKGSLSWETTTPATIRTRDENGAPLLQSTVLTAALRLVFQPIINANGNITLRMYTFSELSSEGKTPLTGFKGTTLAGSRSTSEIAITIGNPFILGSLQPNDAPNKKFSIVPFGTLPNVDAPAILQTDATAKTDAAQDAPKRLFIEITASLATPATQTATR